jgi:hypothetical protein
MFTVNRNPSPKVLHKFGLAMLLGFGVIGAIAWLSPWFGQREAALLGWTNHGAKTAALVLWALGVLLLAISFAPAGLARPVYVGWMTVTVWMGVVLSTILLTLLFVAFLPLFSLIVRFGDPLRKKLGGATYWEPYRPHEPTLERMRRPF